MRCTRKKAAILEVGPVSYRDAWQIQRDTWEKVYQGHAEAVLVFCRHHPVITTGRRGEGNNLLVSKEVLAQRGIGLHRAERGGEITYHGPGQLTVYPVVNLNKTRRDLHWFVRALETVIIATLAECRLLGQRHPGLTGVWVAERKIASIGIALRRWITWHGFSVNLAADDLDNFSLIRPCGLNVRMTSVEREAGRRIDPAFITEKLVKHF
ncbi:MAG: lipoyl(octanoyl) transferase LipB, partial [Candidatus Omnitrophica bacterium]|nr:lipoyl(octanoyl) transferase LipB [Candidatus Omnitrophota bacterium]